MNQPFYTLDRTDIRILELLQQDGKISNIKLAEAVNLSATAVLARVQKLTKDGFILGYEAHLNPKLLHHGFVVFIEIILDRTTANALEQFAEVVKDIPEIMECHMISGGFDFLLKIRCAHMDDYRKISGQVLWKLPGVKETRSYPVMEVIKETRHMQLQ